MSNAKLILCQVLIVVCMISSIVLGSIVVNTMNNVLRLSVLDSEISTLSSLNSEFDFYILNSSFYSNFDDINQKSVDISNIKDSITTHNVLNIVDIDKLNDLYIAKHRLAISLVSSSASLFNIQTAAITLGYKSNIDDKTAFLLNKIVVLTNDLYFQTMQDSNNVETIKKLIEQINMPNNDYTEKTKEKMIYALNTMLNIKIIKDNISKDPFTSYVNTLAKDVETLFAIHTDTLYKYSIYFAISISFLLLLAIILSTLVNFANCRNSIIMEVFERLPIELIIFNKKQKPFFINNRAEERHKLMHENSKVVPYFDFDEKMQNELNSNGVYIDNTYQPGRASRVFRLSIFKMPENVNKIKNYFLCKIDVTGEKAESGKLKQEIKKLVNDFNIDKLTGLGSPQALEEKLANNRVGILVYVTLKHFDNMRFYYKASVIDEIIKKFAHSLETYADEYGIAITRSDYEKLDSDEKKQKENMLMERRLYRLYLDEFCFWVNNEKELLTLNRMLREKYEEPFELVNIDELVGSINNLEIRYGISQPSDGNTNRLNQAILACYEAEKRDEFFCAYSVDLKIEQQYVINQRVMQIIKYALNEQNDCKIFLQCQGIHQINPLIKDKKMSYADYFSKDIANDTLEDEGKICYYECLVRLMDEKGNIWYPNSFLDIAKQSSLYTKITLKVMEFVFDLIDKTDSKFSMNLSSIDMVDKEVTAKFEEYLKNCKAKNPEKPSNLCLEILESESVSDYESIKSFIKLAKDYGCKIAIDDFGSGFSNYYRLLEVQLDYLKIDGSIIKKLPTDKNARTALQSIVDFANNQKYDVVAEFVSDEEILNYVRALGITKVQGWAFSKPRNATDIF